jgi:hypothetical protein
MDKPISVGDLVVIVRLRECCPENTKLGLIYRVNSLRTAEYACHYCGKPHGGQWTVAWGEGNVGANVVRLKRIPPLSDLEGERTQEDIREPA